MSLSPRERARRKAKLMKQLIEDLDAVRALRLFNTSRALRNLSELSFKGDLWEKLEEALRKIALIPAQDVRFPMLRRIDSVSDILFMLSFVVMVGALILLVLSRGPEVSYIALLVSLIILNASYLMKLYVSINLRAIYRSRLDEIMAMDGLFKRAVESLLARLRGELKKAGLYGSQVRFTLFSNDYTGVVVLEGKKGVYKLRLKD